MFDEVTPNPESQPQSTSDGFERFRASETAAVPDAETNPEPTADETAEVTDPAENVSDETPDSTEEAESAEGELPRWLEDLELSDEEMADYRKRYPAAFAPEAPEDLRYLLRDKVKSDRIVQERLAPESEEPTPDPEEQAPKAPQSREEYNQQIEKFVSERLDKDAIHQLGTRMLRAFGVDPAQADNPKLSAEAREEIRQYVNRAPQIGATLAAGAVDLVGTMIPQMLNQMVEAQFPGFSQMYERSLYGLAWDNVRTGEEAYQKLPAYGTEQFKAVLAEAAKQIPGFDEIRFPGNRMEQAQAKYKILAKIASGQKVNPAVVAEAVETGKRIAGAQQSKRAAGKALGAGQGKPFGNTSTADPLMEEIQKHNSGLTIGAK